jgi:hypothetical protein
LLREPGNRRLATLVVIALVALAALILLLLSGSSSSPSSPSSPVLHPRKIGPISIFEADSQIDAAPVGTLELLRSLGVDRVRVFVPWGELPGRPSIAPDPSSKRAPSGFDAADPAAYPASGWAMYDAIDRASARTGVGVYFELGSPPPLWAAGPGAPRGTNPHPQWRPSAQQYGSFVHAIAQRYSGGYTPPGASSPLPRIDFWGIWNEPNYGVDLAPQAVDDSKVEVSPALYRGMLDAAWTALQATGHGQDTILIGELAPRGITTGNNPGNFSGMVPLRFVRALYCVDSSYRPLRGAAATARGCPATATGSAEFEHTNPALFRASGYAIHPYPQAAAPDVTTPNEPDYADLPALGNLEASLDRAVEAYGSDKRFSLYSTEYGYKTNPPYSGGVPIATAAGYENWAEYLSWRDPRVLSYDQYLLSDPSGTSGSDFATGIEFADGTPKPTLFDAYRMPLYLPKTSASSAKQALEVWGCVRPALQARQLTNRVQHVEIQLQRAPGGQFTRIARIAIRDPHGYFDVARRFPASGAVRLRWAPPHDPPVFSRTVTITVH